MPPVPQLDDPFYDFSQTPQGKEIALPYVPREDISPACTVFPPWEHQLKAYRALWNATALLIDLDCRAGKTKVIIDYLCNKPIADVRRTLVICPKSVIPVWEEEAQKHAGKPLVIAPLYTGSVADHQKEAQRCLAEAKHRNAPALCIINYESMWREPFKTWALAVGWSLVVYDESHSLAAAGSKQGLFAYRLSKRSLVRVEMSGTPLPQGEESVYGTYRALDPTLFGTNHADHLDTYFTTDPYTHKHTIRPEKLPEMKRKVNSIRLHIKATDLRLPPVVESVIPVVLPEKAMRLYIPMEDEYYASLDDHEFTAANAAVSLIRLQQITSGYLPDADTKTLVPLHTAKQEALATFLSGLPPEEPVVVFCRFSHDIAAVYTVAKACKRLSSELSGPIKTVRDWKAGNTSVLACQLKAASAGIDLSRSNYVVYYSLNFSWVQWQQSQERVRIHDKKASIGLYYLLARGTVDERIKKALEHRGDTIAALMTIPAERA